MPGPAPAVARTRGAVREMVRLFAPPGAGLLAAVSGGADSLALAAALAFEGSRAGVRAGAVVVDHGLQTDSADVAVRAARQCESLGLDPVDVVRVEVRPGGDGPEAAARRARYAALEAARREHGASHVLLGHTRDDQAEQVLLGLLRGSGARSLAGMPAATGHWLRPFLDISRDETESACTASGLTPWRDPHNDDDRYARVRARALLAELTERLGAPVTGNLARTARLLREDADALDAWAQDALTAARRGDRAAEQRGLEPPEVTIDVAALADLPRAVRTRVLRRVLLGAGATGAALAAVHVDEVDRLVTDWRGQGPVDLPGHRQVERREGSLVVGPRRRC